jgi:hypothetical protein
MRALGFRFVSWGWAIVGVVLGVAAQTLAWYVGAEAPCGLLCIAVDLVIAAIVGALLYPVAVMANIGV